MLVKSDIGPIHVMDFSGIKPKQIAQHFGVTVRDIKDVLSGRTWSEVPKPTLVEATSGAGYMRHELTI